MNYNCELERRNSVWKRGLILTFVPFLVLLTETFELLMTKKRTAKERRACQRNIGGDERAKRLHVNGIPVKC
jgi:hypothetical protein